MKSIKKKSTYINNRNNKPKIQYKNKKLFYKYKNYQLDIHSNHKQNGITIKNPTPYNETFPEQNLNTINISLRSMPTTNNNMTKQHEPTHNPNIFHQIAIDTNLKILTPTEYNHIKEDKTKRQ